MNKKTTIQQANEIMLAACEKTTTERVPLDSAYGRVLAADLIATANIPAFDRSAFDGYAFCAEDTLTASRGNPVTLRVIGEVPAGHVPTVEVTRGTAVKILTGAPVPRGADAITKYEETVYTADSVTISKSFESGANIIRAGEDVRAGDLLSRDGYAINGATVASAAAQGVTELVVYRKPVVGIIATGTEIVEADETLSYAKIRETNRYTLAGACLFAGAEPRYLGHAGDDVASIARLLSRGFDECDVVISTGGVSAGDYDLTPDALAHTGAEILVRNIRMKPGGSCAFGVRGGVPAFCLSGSPGASLLCFYANVYSTLRKICGYGDVHLRKIHAKLDGAFEKTSPVDRLVRGSLVFVDGTVYFRAARQGNTVISSFIGSDAVAIIPSGSGAVPDRALIEVFII